jgi:5-formyltetrahydrofolate cyclo-ligase
VPGTVTRSRVRAARREVAAVDAERSAALVAERVGTWIDSGWERARVGGYVAFDGELDPAPLGERLRGAQHSTWLPVCVDDRRLRFRRWDGHQPLVSGPFGTSHPEMGDTVEGTSLDVVLVPLVAFDRRGHRVGFGAGFYDRTFEGPERPLLVGLAHDLQELPPWQPEPWDVTLDAVATPTRWVTAAGDGGPPPARSAQADAMRSD